MRVSPLAVVLRLAGKLVRPTENKTNYFQLFMQLEKTSVQSHSTKGRIAVLLTRAAMNVFVRSWPHLVRVSLDPCKSASPKRHLDRFSRFLHSSPVRPTHRHTDRATCDICCRRCSLIICKMCMGAHKHGKGEGELAPPWKSERQPPWTAAWTQYIDGLDIKVIGLIRCTNASNRSATGGFAPWPPDQGLCPKPRWWLRLHALLSARAPRLPCPLASVPPSKNPHRRPRRSKSSLRQTGVQQVREAACVRDEEGDGVVERQRADEVQNKPRSQVVMGDLLRIENYFIRLVFSHNACHVHCNQHSKVSK